MVTFLFGWASPVLTILQNCAPTGTNGATMSLFLFAQTFGLLVSTLALGPLITKYMLKFYEIELYATIIPTLIGSIFFFFSIFNYKTNLERMKLDRRQSIAKASEVLPEIAAPLKRESQELVV